MRPEGTVRTYPLIRIEQYAVKEKRTHNPTFRVVFRAA
jgi:hypothetical protein